MLTQADNEMITKTGPGTPMGELFRRFWQPVLLSSDLPENDGEPQRIKVLGENLVAYRDTNGDVGVIDNYCPHRRASMFFGRNEECGMRCVYHGWKFDKDGTCTDMPSEPAESNFKDKVKIKAYPAKEAGTVVWIYMGPSELQPELPQFEWCTVPDGHQVVTRWIQQSNYLQAMEGEIDTSHVSFNHRWFDLDPALSTIAILNKMATDGSPRLTVRETESGFIYGSRRDYDNQYYWRCTQLMVPMYSLIPGNAWPRGGRGWVPVDDEHNMVFQYASNPERPLTEEEVHLRMTQSPQNLHKVKYTLPDGYVIDTWIPERTPQNDYNIDREMQKTVNYVGIPSTREQDMAMTDSMGAIADRTKEHLGTSDTAIIAARQILLKLARDLQEGQEPYASQHPEVFAVRAINVVDPEPEFDKLLEKHGNMGKVNA